MEENCHLREKCYTNDINCCILPAAKKTLMKPLLTVVVVPL